MDFQLKPKNYDFIFAHQLCSVRVKYRHSSTYGHFSSLDRLVYLLFLSALVSSLYENFGPRWLKIWSYDFGNSFHYDRNTLLRSLLQAFYSILWQSRSGFQIHRESFLFHLADFCPHYSILIIYFASVLKKGYYPDLVM